VVYKATNMYVVLLMYIATVVDATVLGRVSLRLFENQCYGVQFVCAQ
jgi:hypothetical protein